MSNPNIFRPPTLPSILGRTGSTTQNSPVQPQIGDGLGKSRCVSHRTPTMKNHSKPHATLAVSHLIEAHRLFAYLHLWRGHRLGTWGAFLAIKRRPTTLHPSRPISTPSPTLPPLSPLVADLAARLSAVVMARQKITYYKMLTLERRVEIVTEVRAAKDWRAARIVVSQPPSSSEASSEEEE